MRSSKSWSGTNPGVKRSELAQCFEMSVFSLNSIVLKKDAILETPQRCGKEAKKTRKIKSSPYREIENVLMEWFLQKCTEGLPVEGTVLREKSLKISAHLGISNVVVSNFWLVCFI
jgi:hypothetical protein